MPHEDRGHQHLTPPPVSEEDASAPGAPAQQPQRNGDRLWKATAMVFGVIISFGIIVGVMGSAFFVSRAEYTQKAQEDAVVRETITRTMERLDRTLAKQEEAFGKLAETVNTIKVDLAVIGK